jgi:hypothetical protein
MGWPPTGDAGRDVPETDAAEAEPADSLQDRLDSGRQWGKAATEQRTGGDAHCQRLPHAG